MGLVGTNIFLEILLDQDRRADCERFLENESGDLCISDFTLYSIGIYLFRHDMEDQFDAFVRDTVVNLRVISLSSIRYTDLTEVHGRYGFTFDDSYQYCVARENGLALITMDNDFRKVDDIEVRFL